MNTLTDRSNIKDSIINDVKYIKRRKLPKNIVDIISLQANMKHLMREFAPRYPNMFAKLLNKNGSDGKIDHGVGDKMDSLLAEVSKIDTREIQRRIMDTERILDDIIERRVTPIKSIDISRESINKVRVNSSEGSSESNIYSNSLLDDNRFMLDRLFILGSDIDSTDVDHLKFISSMAKSDFEGKIYRYVDKGLIEKNINIIKSMRDTVPNTYNRYRHTIDTLAVFLNRLNNVIGDDVIDVNKISTCNDDYLRYGTTLLNEFKLFIDGVSQRQ